MSDELVVSRIPSSSRPSSFASQAGLNALTNIITADDVWRSLTKPQRELLLSSVAGYPIRARVDVVERLIQRGLIGLGYEPTEAGRAVVAWRLP